jgi:uncharacterized membrane protein
MRLKNERIIALVLWLAAVGVSLWGYANLPDLPIATHYNAAGHVNGYMPRDQALIFMPALLLVLNLLLLWLLPAIMPRKTNIDRFEAIYGLLTLLVPGLLTLVHLVLVLNAAGFHIEVTRVVLTGVGIVFAVLGNFLPKTRMNWLLGIRTPWTLSDERVWERTHRVAGPLFVLGGGVVVLTGFFAPLAWHVPAILIAALAPSAISVVYSYMAARRLNLV